jgi:hypothetical protein
MKPHALEVAQVPRHRAHNERWPSVFLGSVEPCRRSSRVRASQPCGARYSFLPSRPWGRYSRARWQAAYDCPDSNRVRAVYQVDDGAAPIEIGLAALGLEHHQHGLDVDRAGECSRLGGGQLLRLWHRRLLCRRGCRRLLRGRFRVEDGVPDLADQRESERTAQRVVQRRPRGRTRAGKSGGPDDVDVRE